MLIPQGGNVSFVVVNTGRAASRAVHLNLRAQPGLSGCSRYHLDEIVTAFIDRGSLDPLDALAGDLGARLNGVLGFVFHGVRPRLAFPFDDPRNLAVLRALRDRLGIETAYLVVREPRQVLHSELNRQLALVAGDWRFPASSWRSVVQEHELGRAAAGPIEPIDTEGVAAQDLGSLAEDIAGRTGKVGSLYRLFDSVFADVVVIPYDLLADNPGAVFDAMAARSGFGMVDRQLVGVRLNGLANRLLVYNPFQLVVDGRALRLRFEMEPVIGRCDDWGTHTPLRIESGPVLADMAARFDLPVGLGVDTVDLESASPHQRNRLSAPDFEARVVEHVRASFVANFTAAYDAYRHDVYRVEWPEEPWERFALANADEIDVTQALLDEARAGFDAKAATA